MEQSSSHIYFCQCIIYLNLYLWQAGWAQFFLQWPAASYFKVTPGDWPAHLHISKQSWDSAYTLRRSLLLPTPALYKTCLDSLDQVYPVVDGGPVEECNVFFVWLPNIETRLYQLSAALEDAVPGDEWRRGVKVSSHTNTDKHRVKYIRLTHSDKMHTRIKT